MKLNGLFQEVPLTMWNRGSCIKAGMIFNLLPPTTQWNYLPSNKYMIHLRNAQRLPVENQITNSHVGTCG